MPTCKKKGRRHSQHYQVSKLPIGEPSVVFTGFAFTKGGLACAPPGHHVKRDSRAEIYNKPLDDIRRGADIAARHDCDER